MKTFQKSGARRALLSSSAVLALLFCCTASLAAVIRVKWDSPSGGPGDNWNSGYRRISSGLNAARAGGPLGDQGPAIGISVLVGSDRSAHARQ